MSRGALPRGAALQRSAASLKLLEALKLPEPWRHEGWCLYRNVRGQTASPRVAAFDFDKTLHFGGAAWHLSSAHIPRRLQQLHKEGHRIAVFSNQHAAGRQRTMEAMEAAVFQTLGRFDAFAEFCNVPMDMFIAAARGDIDDPHRKPNTGMWQLLCSANCSVGVMPDAQQSFYVGNAAGRFADNSNADREFARRAGLDFRTEDWL
eukprot:TRINITY_DN30632_c0_g1_i2.p1 TRINITY_DN30632_c0_g1~~TRINITY_DN30632_c0_g1_i2.p1  ORF type:complete len:205 (-),score=52.97 TRINITY_DN30632_c0_g1_i2:408-1022(-)